MIVFNFGNVSTPQNLQNVTDIGNITTNDIVIQQTKELQLQNNLNTSRSRVFVGGIETTYDGYGTATLGATPQGGVDTYPSFGTMAFKSTNAAIISNIIQARQFFEPPKIPTLPGVGNIGLSMPVYNAGVFCIPIKVNGMQDFAYMQCIEPGYLNNYTEYKCECSINFADFQANITTLKDIWNYSLSFMKTGDFLFEFNGFSPSPLVGFAVVGFPEPPYYGKTFGYFMVDSATGEILSTHYGIYPI